jgi:hypothetical protein
MKVITIGRSRDNDIVISDNLVSRNHLQIIQDDSGNFRLADLGSKNGTFVNGRQVNGEVYLNPNDVVRIGNTTLPWKRYFKAEQELVIMRYAPEPTYIQSNNEAQKAQIEVKIGFFPLAFLFLFCSPVVEINEQKYRSSWGTRSFDLPEGEYYISIYVPYLFWRRCGENSINVRAIAGKVTKISFYAPLIVFAKGRIKIKT